MGYPYSHAGQVDITGLIGPIVQQVGADPAVQSALSAIAATPQFHQLVQQHRAYMAGAAMGPPVASAASYGGPGAAYGGTPMVKERELRDIREFSLGFKQANIAANGSFNVTSRPQQIFRGERLVIPESPAGLTGSPLIVDEFDILDLKVGNKSQIVEATTLPSRAFAEVAVGVRLALDTASIAQDIVIAVQETLGFSATFKAVMFGTCAQ